MGWEEQKFTIGHIRLKHLWMSQRYGLGWKHKTAEFSAYRQYLKILNFQGKKITQEKSVQKKEKKMSPKLEIWKSQQHQKV